MVIVKAVAVLALMIAVFYLGTRAKRMDYDRFQAKHGRRKYRVPADQASDSNPNEGPQ